MSARAYTLREMSKADDAAASALVDACPDGGLVKFKFRHHIPLHQMLKLQREQCYTVLAQSQDKPDEVLGMGSLGFSTLRVDGSMRRVALLYGLMVHPKARRLGIARALAEWRIAKAKAIAGDDVIIVAGIQVGNRASMGNAQKWATQVSYRMKTVPVPTLKRPPTAPAGLRFRRATAEDAAAFVAAFNDFHQDYNFALVFDTERFQMPFPFHPLSAEERLFDFWLAEKAEGELLAGAMLYHTQRIESLELVQMPLLMRLVSHLLVSIPLSGVIDLAELHHFWHRPGHQSAAAALWQHLRHICHGECDGITVSMDARAPLWKAIRQPLIQPRTTIEVAIHAPEPINTKAIAFNPIF